ncbi:MAG: fibronectin type III domain-containing protein [Nitrospirae bacterium]|nr:fibronectin type III domain-containing protein [Candidatus Manganitrophaceae bacterium]
MILVFRKSVIRLLLFVFSTLFAATPVLAEQAALSWSPNTAPDLAGYVLYYKDDSNGLPLTKTQFTEKIVLLASQTNYTKTGLTEGTHYFALSAFDTSANESDLSVVVQKTTLSSVFTETTPGQKGTTAGGGGCGMVFPKTESKPPGPGDAAIMVFLFTAACILLIKKTLQTVSRHRFALT